MVDLLLYGWQKGTASTFDFKDQEFVKPWIRAGLLKKKKLLSFILT